GSVNSSFIATPPALPQTDPNPADNTASSSLPVVISGDLVATVTPTGPATFAGGSKVTYTATITNNGPSQMNGVNITDSFAPPAGLTGVTFTSVGGAGTSGNTNGSGTINDFVNLPPGKAITY